LTVRDQLLRSERELVVILMGMLMSLPLGMLVPTEFHWEWRLGFAVPMIAVLAAMMVKVWIPGWRWRDWLGRMVNKLK
jgi:hypothetical protein